MHIGIDPGTTGAISFVDGENIKMFNLPIEIVKTKSYQKKYLNMNLLVDILLAHSDPAKDKVALEHVSAMPNQGVSSTGVLMRIFGQLEGVLITLGYNVTLVRPAKWKKHLALTSDKGESKKYLSTRYKLGRCNHNQTDATCIAVWLKETEQKEEQDGDLKSNKKLQIKRGSPS